MTLDLSALPKNIADAAQELCKKYEFSDLICKGANGYVLVGVNKLLERKVAVKFYYWGDGAHPEPQKLSTLASPHVLPVQDAAPIDNDYAYFVTPFCDHGDLDDILSQGNIGVIQAVDHLQHIASGASFIHGAGYIHRDLKPSNIFCQNDGKLVIGDFGSLVKIGEEGYSETGSKHSLIYRTPEEILTQRAYTQGDIYQLGIVFYQLLGGSLSYELQDWLTAKQKETCGALAYPDNEICSDKAVEELIKKGKVIDYSSLPAWCPQSLISVVRKCTKVDIGNRFESVSALKTRLSNIRSSLPDWRLEPSPTLYRPHAKFRLIQVGNSFRVEKFAKSGTSWRKVHQIKPGSISEVIKRAEQL